MPIINPMPLPETQRKFNVTQRRELAYLSRINTASGPRLITVQPGEDIQAALNKLDNAGGGVVMLKQGTHTLLGNISGRNRVSLIGEGRDTTIIEANGNARGLDYTGTATVQLTNFELRDFTLQNSNNTYGIDLIQCDFYRVSNVRITSCDQGGIRFSRSQYFTAENVRSDNNTGIGVAINSDSTRNTIKFTLTNVVSDVNTGDGFDIAGGSTAHTFGTFIGCLAETNGGKGYDCNLATMNFIACNASDNTGDGFEINAGATNGRFIGCFSRNNTGEDFDINIGSAASTDFVMLIGCSYGFSSTIVPHDEVTDLDNFVLMPEMGGGSTRTSKRILRMKNTSGATIAAGDVVTFKAAANGDEITTTTTGGDDFVFGMSMQSILNTNYGNILVEGYTKLLKVNGTTDVAIGDLLSTFTTAGIAKKALAGEMCFAIALEAYATDDSLGVIDALIISPRLI